MLACVLCAKHQELVLAAADVHVVAKVVIEGFVWVGQQKTALCDHLLVCVKVNRCRCGALTFVCENESVCLEKEGRQLWEKVCVLVIARALAKQPKEQQQQTAV